MLAGTTAGTDSGDSSHRGGRKPYLQRLAAKFGQHGGIPGVGVEEFGAKPVDEQHARPCDIARKSDSNIEARHAHRGEHRRDHVGEVASVGIRSRQVHPASRIDLARTSCTRLKDSRSMSVG